MRLPTTYMKEFGLILVESKMGEYKKIHVPNIPGYHDIAIMLAHAKSQFNQTEAALYLDGSSKFEDINQSLEYSNLVFKVLKDDRIIESENDLRFEMDPVTGLFLRKKINEFKSDDIDARVLQGFGEYITTLQEQNKIKANR